MLWAGRSRVPIQLGATDFCLLRNIWLEREVNQTPPFSSKIKIEWSFTSTPTIWTSWRGQRQLDPFYIDGNKTFFFFCNSNVFKIGSIYQALSCFSFIWPRGWLPCSPLAQVSVYKYIRTELINIFLRDFWTGVTVLQ